LRCQQGSDIPGFDASQPIAGDQLAAMVNWPNAELEQLAGRKVCLRILLRRAQLYCYWIQ